MIRHGWHLTGTLLLALGLLTLLAPTAGASAASPLLRVVHAASGASSVAVYLDGQPVTSALQFGAATPYARVPAGEHQLQVYTGGAGPTGQPLLEARVTLQADQAYTVVAANTAVKMEPVVLTDTLDALASAAPDKAHVRLVHASPDAPSVADIALAGGGPVVFKEVAFKAHTGYLAVDAATYRFEVRPAGAVQALATTDAITLAPGGIYTVFAIGQLGDNTFRAIIMPDNARTGGVGSAPSAGAGGMAPQQSDPAWPLLAAGLVALCAALGLRAAASRARS